MPRQFRDDLPVLLDRFKNRRSEPKREHEVTYAEVEPWLKAGPRSEEISSNGLRFDPRIPSSAAS